MNKLKKAALCFFTILSLTTTLLSVKPRTIVKSETNIIRVPDDYLTIQEAVGYANEGDMVYVRNGTYFGTVLVDKKISLIGENRESTIIDGVESDYVIIITADNVTIQGFTIMNSRKGTGLWCGVHVLSPSDGNFISNNNITNNQVGIVLWASNNNTIQGNAISSNEYNGIHLIQSFNNLFSGNLISSNDNKGIYFSMGCNNNIVFHNNFINNREHVAYDPIADINNFFDNDYPSGGNYWSDYNGSDLFMGPLQNASGSDGIGDALYNIYKTDRDRYPLMGPFYDFPVTLKGETYHFNIISNSTISDFVFEVRAETGSRNVLFKATNLENTIGFCKATIPTSLMKGPYVVLIGNEDTEPIFLNALNETRISLYFTYGNINQIIKIISSETMHLLQQLLDKYEELQTDFSNLNRTHYDVLEEFADLLWNYTNLRENFSELNGSYQEHIVGYAEDVDNLRSLMYMFAATTAIFLLTTVYLSKNASQNKAKETKPSKDEK